MSEKSDIGEQFQKAREKRRLSLEDVAHETRIPLSTLKSLEKNDYSGFASPAYARSFLDQYSHYLKIDAHEIIESFNTGNVLEQPDSIEYLDQEKSSSPPRASSTRRRPAQSTQGSASNVSQPLLILLITGGLIAGGVWGFIAVEKRFNAPQKDTTAAESDPDPAPSVEGTPAEPPSLAATPSAKKDPRPARTISPNPPKPVASIPQETIEDDPNAPVYVFPEDTPPPRAIIVNEDEDE